MVYLIDAVALIITTPIKLIQKRSVHLEPRKILIAKLDHLGDIVIAGPTLNALRKRFKDSRISLLVNDSSAELLTCINTEFDRILTLDAGWVRHGRGLNLGLKQIYGLIKWMHSEKFDLFIDLRGDAVTVLAASLAGIPEKVGFGWSGLGTLLEKNFRILPERHMSEVLFQVAQYFQAGAESTPLIFNHDEGNAGLADSFLDKSGFKADGPLIGMHIGAGVPARRWPPEKFAQLTDLIIRQFDVTVVVFGDSSERKLLSAFNRDYRGKLIDAVGKLSLPVVVEIISRLQVLVANNSFLGHVAALGEIPVISIFSSSNDPVRWRPYGSKVEVITAEVDCRGCGLEVCPLPESCLNRISVDRVFNSISRLLESTPNMLGGNTQEGAA